MKLLELCFKLIFFPWLGHLFPELKEQCLKHKYPSSTECPVVTLPIPTIIITTTTTTTTTEPIITTTTTTTETTTTTTTTEPTTTTTTTTLPPTIIVIPSQIPIPLTTKCYIKVPKLCLKLYAFPLLAKLAKWKGLCPSFMYQHGVPIQHKTIDEIEMDEIQEYDDKLFDLHNYVTINRE